MLSQAGWSYPTYDLVMVGQVGFAILATIYLLCVEVDVVGEDHLVRKWALGRILPALPMRLSPGFLDGSPLRNAQIFETETSEVVLKREVKSIAL